jgi:calpain-7
MDCQISGKWSERTAGGNHTYHTFMNNPQYSIKISPLPGQTSLLADLSITCETTKELSVNIKVVRSDRGRVAEYVLRSSLPSIVLIEIRRYEERDVIGGASQYSYGMASIRTREVQREYQF